MQTVMAYPFVLSLALSAVVGTLGLHLRPFPGDNVLLALIAARRPALYDGGSAIHSRTTSGLSWC